MHYSDKTQFMLIKPPNVKGIGIDTDFKLFMRNHQIERTNHYKYLGVLIDDHLNLKLQMRNYAPNSLVYVE